MNKIKNNNQSGFTLIELLVSIFIIVVITGLFLINYYSANDKQKLITATQQLASDIRLAQSYALGLKEFQGAIPAGGWGVNFYNLDYYEIFGDSNSDQAYQPNESHRVINLPEGITINIVADMDIVFLPPDPVTYIGGDPSTSIQIVLTDGYTSKTIEVNSLGLIDILD